MKLSVLVDALRTDLAGLAGLGDDATALAAQRLAAVLDNALTLRLLDALGEGALELSGQLPRGRIEVRLSGGEVELVYVDEREAPAEEADLSARITLRLPETLKVRIEAAAGSEGISTNSWVIRALSQATQTRRGPTIGRRLSGYGRS
ncbi:MAG: toxin-antitoxin system HicB family antitoxin [Acidimicrobiales bacterium]